ncbi:MAG: hypothetical protein PHE89_05325 [Alphaproteobacteria bacterium]|nr:hypothetical protein [Alphaproteobacteria bacterium]
MKQFLKILWDYSFGKHSILAKLGFGESIKKEFYRKWIHLSSLWLVIYIYFVPTTVAFYSFVVLFILDFILEYGNYKKWNWVRATYSRLFYKAFRSKEMNKNKFEMTGSLYLLAAAALCSLLFVKEITIVALSVMIVSDACAALFGKVYGMRKLCGKKTVEGTFAFLVSALTIMLLLNFIFPVTYKSIIACFLATFAELYNRDLKIDDNLSVPLVIGFILTML